MKQLPIGKFHGIGPATESKMQDLGVYTGEDLLAWDLEELKPLFGKVSNYYYHAARGLDHRKVVSHRQRKSIGSEKTYNEDVGDIKEMLLRLEKLAEEVWQDLTDKHMTARTVTVKVKFDNFVQVTRAITLANDICKLEDITAPLRNLLYKADVDGRSVRLLGVSVSKLTMLEQVDEEQLTLL